MSDDLVRSMIRNIWYTSPSQRTALYYGYLLTRRGRGSILTELEDTTSLQETEFAAMINLLIFHRIMEPGERCLFTPVAMSEIENLFIEEFGNIDGDPFNGLKIFEENSVERAKIWMRGGEDYLRTLFEHMDGLQITSEQADRNKRIVTLEWTLDTPVLTFCFVNTNRMTRMTEFEPLRAHVEGIVLKRLQQITMPNPRTLNGLKTISIMAAPTYTPAVARAAFEHSVPTRIIGPINLTAIGHYLKEHPYDRVRQYKALLQFLDPLRGGMRGGIVFAPPLVKYIATYQED